jgi:hypothetical protein
MNMRALALACLVLAAVPAIAAEPSLRPASSNWRDIITADDQRRLDDLWDIRNRASREADAAIAAREVSAMEAAADTRPLLDATPTLVRDEDVIGRYRCRVTKLGGQHLQLIRYTFFACRIHEGPEGSLVIRKISGSQRFIGRLWLEPNEDSYVYLGTTLVNDDQPIAYNTDPKENSVGRLYRIGKDRLRLELPDPYYESTLDVYELVRTR